MWPPFSCAVFNAEGKLVANAPHMPVHLGSMDRSVETIIRLNEGDIQINLVDKHDTHVAVVLRVIAAIRQMPPDIRPEKLYGCEVWRDLDWMLDSDKVVCYSIHKPPVRNKGFMPLPRGDASWTQI